MTEQVTSSEFLSSSTQSNRGESIYVSVGEVKATQTCLESLDLSFS